jgi:peptide/nickel transport system substrate-binding protein
MDTSLPRRSARITRRELLTSGLAAGVAFSAGPVLAPRMARAQGKSGGILRVRGYDPPHFDPHQTLNFKTNTTLSFVYSKLVRHKVGPTVTPGTFPIEGDLAERWEEPDDTTVVFYLRRGVKWHKKPPVNGRELTADDIKFTYDRFLTEKGNPQRFMLDSVDRVEVVDRYTVRFKLKEPFVWLVAALANPINTWVVAREAVEKFGDLKRPETAIGTGPFMLERYEPNVKTVFKRHPEYFRAPLPYVDGVEWTVMEDDSVGLAAYTTGQIDAGPWHFWVVRQADLPALKKRRNDLQYRDVLSTVANGIYMRTDKPPFNDVRVRRAISHAVDRRAIIDAVYIKGEPSPAVAPGLAEWSAPIDQLGAGARYYQHDPKEARRLLAEAGFPNGFKTQLSVTGGYGADAMDAFQVVQRQLKESGIDAALNVQEYGAYIATTFQGKYEGMAAGPFSISWEPHSNLYGMYVPEQARNSSHVTDAKMLALLREEMRTKDLAARKKLVLDLQRHAAEQQYYVYLYSLGYTTSWPNYVKGYAPNVSFDYGNRAAALWLDR